MAVKDWITYNPASGTGTGVEITVTPKTNYGRDTRSMQLTATLNGKTGNLNVSQKGSGVTNTGLKINPSTGNTNDAMVITGIANGKFMKFYVTPPNHVFSSPLKGARVQISGATGEQLNFTTDEDGMIEITPDLGAEQQFTYYVQAKFPSNTSPEAKEFTVQVDAWAQDDQSDINTKTIRGTVNGNSPSGDTIAFDPDTLEFNVSDSGSTTSIVTNNETDEWTIS